jgi:DNA-binding MarR family transcriptional regulator
MVKKQLVKRVPQENDRRIIKIALDKGGQAVQETEQRVGQFRGQDPFAAHPRREGQVHWILPNDRRGHEARKPAMTN